MTDNFARASIGIEVLDVSQRFSVSDIVNVSIENLPVEAVV
jgi:hypothetical protein